MNLQDKNRAPLVGYVRQMAILFNGGKFLTFNGSTGPGRFTMKKFLLH